MKQAIIGIEKDVLSENEMELINLYHPYGIILFKRNCINPNQVIELNKSIKKIFPEIKIFIDQEGGRVARLRKPQFEEFPAAATFRDSTEVYYNYKSMGEYLYNLGVDANCAPVGDLLYSDGDNIIGDRAFGSTPDQVIDFAGSAAEGLLDSGIMPVIKHIPGHGRAKVDSHIELPIVNAKLEDLEETDFKVFKKLNYLPLAMTAHIIYTAIDPDLPVSISKKSIRYIRERVGFKGAIMSDDINMKALDGEVDTLAKQVIDAGCDIVLHCNGIIEESRRVLKAI